MRVIEEFNSVNYEWSSVEAFDLSGQKITSLRQVAYRVIDDGNHYYDAIIGVDNSAYNKLLDEVKKSNGRDLLDLTLDIKVVYKDDTARQLQHKTLKGVVISEQIKNPNGYLTFHCLFIRIE